MKTTLPSPIKRKADMDWVKTPHHPILTSSVTNLAAIILARPGAMAR
jgi:hypothetical protein